MIAIHTNTHTHKTPLSISHTHTNTHTVALARLIAAVEIMLLLLLLLYSTGRDTQPPFQKDTPKWGRGAVNTNHITTIVSFGNIMYLTPFLFRCTTYVCVCVHALSPRLFGTSIYKCAIPGTNFVSVKLLNYSCVMIFAHQQRGHAQAGLLDSMPASHKTIETCCGTGMVVVVFLLDRLLQTTFVLFNLKT